MLSAAASAYNVVDLPESMTLSDAFGIFDASDITRITVSDVSDGQYTDMTREEILDFYYAVQDLTVYRGINPTPFRGIAVNIYTDSDVKSYYLGSGVQIGLYGSENYICYKLNDEDTQKLLYLDDMYHDAEEKLSGEKIHRAVGTDFLKLPETQWSQSFIKEAAAKSLLPYSFTDKYRNSISREEFCILLGNMIAVRGGYKSIESYMLDLGKPYLRNYFDDCAGIDDSVNILYALGIVNGKDNSGFDPYGTLTREEAATLLCKTAEMYMWIGVEGTLAYEDADYISDWARFYVTWTAANGIMTGISDTEFEPQGTYTVEQAVAAIVRLYAFLDR